MPGLSVIIIISILSLLSVIALLAVVILLIIRNTVGESYKLNRIRQAA